MAGEQERERFLREAHVAVLSTLGPRSRPHATPVWYLYDDGAFVMSVGRDSQKHRNVQRNRRAALVVDKRTLPYYAVMVEGRIRIEPALSVDERLRLTARYLGEERARAYVARWPGRNSVTLRLLPEKLIEYHGVAGPEEQGPAAPSAS